MSWLDAVSRDQFNRTGLLVAKDGTETSFRFAYRGSVVVSESSAVDGLDINRRQITIDTPADLKFTLDSKIRINGVTYSVGDVTDVEPEDANGRWRAKAKRIQRLNILCRI